MCVQKKLEQRKLIINVDDAGWDTEEGKDVGYIQESNENNNSYEYTVNAVIDKFQWIGQL